MIRCILLSEVSLTSVIKNLTAQMQVWTGVPIHEEMEENSPRLSLLAQPAG